MNSTTTATTTLTAPPRAPRTYTPQVHDRADPGPRPINYQFLNRRLLWDHWAKMAYVVAPLVNWSSVRRVLSGGAGRLRREARALGIFGGSDGGRGAVSAGRGVGGGDAAAAVLTACAECGANPAKVTYFVSKYFFFLCASVPVVHFIESVEDVESLRWGRACWVYVSTVIVRVIAPPCDRFLNDSLL